MSGDSLGIYTAILSVVSPPVVVLNMFFPYDALRYSVKLKASILSSSLISFRVSSTSSECPNSSILSR